MSFSGSDGGQTPQSSCLKMYLTFVWSYYWASYEASVHILQCYCYINTNFLLCLSILPLQLNRETQRGNLYYATPILLLYIKLLFYYYCFYCLCTYFLMFFILFIDALSSCVIHLLLQYCTFPHHETNHGISYLTI